MFLNYLKRGLFLLFLILSLASSSSANPTSKALSHSHQNGPNGSPEFRNHFIPTTPPMLTWTPTHPIPSTATFTAVNVPPTFTFTPTQVQATATFTPTQAQATATFTATVFQVTATSTVQPMEQAMVGNGQPQLQLKVLTNSAGANQAQDFFEVDNSGAPVKLSDVSIKFWVYDTTGSKVVGAVNTGGCLTNPSCFHQVNGVSVSAAPLPGCGSNANWEVTVRNTDPTVMNAGVRWTNLQTALHLANYSNFSPGTGTWYSPCLTGSGYATDVHYAIYWKGSLVAGAGALPPPCEAVHGTQQLQGHIPSALGNAQLVGDVPGSTALRLAIGLPLRDQQGLQDLIRQLYDPASPQYHHYLTPAGLAATYGPSQSDYQSLSGFAQSKGLTVTQSYANHQLLDVSGTAADIERAFYVNLNYYKRPDGSVFYSLDREPSLDLGVPVLLISGLNNFNLPKTAAGTSPQRTSAPSSAPANGGTGPGGTLIGYDLRNEYVPGVSATGTGQSVALVEFEGYFPGDIAFYEQHSTPALPNVPLQNVLVDGYNGVPNISDLTGVLETSMDIEMVVAMAPGLSAVYVYEGAQPVPFTQLAYDVVANDVLDNVASPPAGIPLSSQVSCSWYGFGDANTLIPFLAYAAQGQSFFMAEGDKGSYNVAGSYLAGFPLPYNDPEIAYMTLVGGTQLTGGTVGSYQTETTWNNIDDAGAGGICTAVGLPAYQVGINPGNPLVSTSNRNMPDVSTLADGLAIVFGSYPGGTSIAYFGDGYGTSASAPLWAGFAALVNQQALAAGNGTLGFANPALYNIGRNPAKYAADFNDIHDGSNNNWFNYNIPGSLYTAVVGYDLATGLGTPKGALVNDLAGIVPTPTPTVCYSESWSFSNDITSANAAAVGQPMAVVEGPPTYLYTIGAGNNLYQLDPATGNILNTYSTGGNITGATAMAVNSAATSFYVADTQGNRVEVFGPTGNLLNSWTTGTTTPFTDLEGIAVNPINGYVYTTDGINTPNSRVQAFTYSGVPINQWQSPPGNGAVGYGIGVDPTGLYVYVTVNGNTTGVEKFTYTGTYVTQWGSFVNSKNTMNGQFYGPTSVAADSSGNVYVLDTPGTSIQVFNPAGAYLGLAVDNSGTFNWGLYYGLAVDKAGTCYFEGENNNIYSLNRFSRCP